MTQEQKEKQKTIILDHFINHVSDELLVNDPTIQSMINEQDKLQNQILEKFGKEAWRLLDRYATLEHDMTNKYMQEAYLQGFYDGQDFFAK